VQQASELKSVWQTFKPGMVGLEDGLVTADVNDLKAHSVLAAVNSYDTLAASPLSNFEPLIGQTTTSGMTGRSCGS
jgi:hypothetical protein